MNAPFVPEPDDQVVAIHESGHLIVGALLGRESEMVSIDKIDGKRGCFWKLGTEQGWDHFSEMRCLIAGPRAQTTLLPESLDPLKLALFRNRIIQPSPSRLQLPEGVYNYTGWQFDVEPVYRYLAQPDAPSDIRFPFGPKRKVVVDRAEVVLLSFFGDPEVQRATAQVAEELRRRRYLAGNETAERVRANPSLKSRSIAWD